MKEDSVRGLKGLRMELGVNDEVKTRLLWMISPPTLYLNKTTTRFVKDVTFTGFRRLRIG